MRTTVDLPDDLFIAAKKRALELHQSFKNFMEATLRKELGEIAQKPKPINIKWVTSHADAPDFDLSSREAMHEWIQRQP